MGFAAPILPFISALGTVFSAVKGLKGEKKPQAAAAPKAAAAAGKTPEQEEDDRRKRIIAMNAGGQTGQMGQMTPAGGVGGQASVSRKTLLGQ